MGRAKDDYEPVISKEGGGTNSVNEEKFNRVRGGRGPRVDKGRG